MTESTTREKMSETDDPSDTNCLGDSMTNRIDQPRRHDLVSNSIMVAGIGTAFEATLQYRIGDGHDEISGHFMAGGGTGEHGQFQLQVDVRGAEFRLDRLSVQIFETSQEDGSEINRVTVPVIYGPRLVPGYLGYREHTVKPGETLSAIADAHYGDPSLYKRIVRANPDKISDPHRILPGQVFRVPVGW
ncbi:Gmad2 immunoglobulin-like domain-containing protein [Streptomyces lavendulocolor]|uniref:Gmad2 immunoglobulin-like domain-containing protein n=1 Tax=Streptomyces lavendulocolor TaxID=67316 RepID=UPI0033D9CEBA